MSLATPSYSCPAKTVLILLCRALPCQGTLYKEFKQRASPDNKEAGALSPGKLPQLEPASSYSQEVVLRYTEAKSPEEVGKTGAPSPDAAFKKLI